MNVFRWVTYSLVLLGAFNWGLIGAFDFDLVSFLFGEMTTITRILYTIIGLSAIGYLVASINEHRNCTSCNY